MTTHPLLARAHLEAVLVARAVVHRHELPVILHDVDRDRLSPAAWALLAQLDDPAAGTVALRTDAQRSLGDRVDAITVADLCVVPSLTTLLALVNQLPPRAHVAPAWERDLQRAAS